MEAEVHRPQHLSELLSLYDRFPDSLLLAGATAVSIGEQSIQGAERVIDIAMVQELKRIRRTDRFMDIGPALSISRILNTGRQVIPRILYDALRSVGTPVLRNMATLGGNVCRASACSAPLTALFALEARLELKANHGSRWLPVSRFMVDDNKTVLRPGEILSSIRIPLGDWDVGIFKPVNAGSETPAAIFCGLACLAKQEIQDLRFAFGSINSTIIRDRKLETPLVGHKLPLAPRDADSVCAELGGMLSPSSGSAAEYQRNTAVRMLRWFVDELNLYHVYRF